MPIIITNYKYHQTVRYSLPLLVGYVSSKCDEIEIQNTTEGSVGVVWPIIQSKFKALVHLVPGMNNIRLKCGTYEIYFPLKYCALNFRKYVRLVYIICKDDNGEFQAPYNEDNSVTSACERISLGACMIQTFTASMLKNHDLKAKSFSLEDSEGWPKCHVFRSCLSTEEALALNDDELWAHFAKELMNSSLRDGNNCKFMGFLSFTRYQKVKGEEPRTFSAILKQVKGHVALGGGGLALFGSACLHTWAQNLQEVPWRFADCRIIDRKHFMDDSGNRKFHWACYATGLGATLHELGHTFDLGHTSSGIMARGFDDIHKFFIVDMFYYNNLFQKKHNPFYKKHDQEDVNVELCVTSSNMHRFENKIQVKKSDCDSSRTRFGHVRPVSDKPPWRAPNPPEAINSIWGHCVGKAHWTRSSALILYYHKWFNDFDDGGESNITLNVKTLSSDIGIRVIEFRNEEQNTFYHLEFLGLDGEKEVDLTDYYKIWESLTDMTGCNGNIVLFTEDSFGNIGKYNIKLEL